MAGPVALDGLLAASETQNALREVQMRERLTGRGDDEASGKQESVVGDAAPPPLAHDAGPAVGGDDRPPRRWRTRAQDALVALGVGLVTGLIAHRLAGDEPLATDPEYVGHVFAEATIVLLAAIIAYWLLDDIRTARRGDAE
jgi:hypothetical protein